MLAVYPPNVNANLLQHTVALIILEMKFKQERYIDIEICLR